MIVRIVKMTFKPECTENFLKLFESKNKKIRAFEGCKRLELLQDAENPNVFFTYSFWISQTQLDGYRNSPLFKETWRITQTLFSEKPQAWSTRQKYILP